MDLPDSVERIERAWRRIEERVPLPTGPLVAWGSSSRDDPYPFMTTTPGLRAQHEKDAALRKRRQAAGVLIERAAEAG